MPQHLVMITDSGIGKALALGFAREGNPLLLISRTIEPMAELAEHGAVWRQATSPIMPRSPVPLPRPRRCTVRSNAWPTAPAG